ncbi:MAG: hypothetical protein JHC28_01295, partial [Thermoprotei archaeon]|nr:hypothetical protein [Thermoprotei archaeon]
SWVTDEEDENIIKEGCFLYDNGEVKRVLGIYYAPRRLNLPIKTGRMINLVLDDARKVIEDYANFAKAQFNRYFDPNRWLIKWYNHHVRIYNYNNLIKGRQIEFPLVGQDYRLVIVKIPPFRKKLPVKKSAELTIGDGTIKFDNEVYIFKPYSFGGEAYIIYPRKLTHTKLGSGTVTLYGGNVYLVTYRRIPKPRPLIDDLL